MFKCIKCLTKAAFKGLLFVLVVILIPGLPPKTTFPFEEFSIVKPKAPSGALELNNHLDNTERLFEGKLLGAENLLLRGKTIYTGLLTGEVVKIDGDHITFVAKFGKPCTGLSQEEICGRPLGLSFDTISDSLIVADGYYGIYGVDLKTNAITQYVASDQVIDGPVPRKAKTINSVAVAKNGDIYWTDSSSDFTIQDGVYSFFANPSGRLIHYSRSGRKNTVLLDKLWFANGLALSPDEDFVVVSETHASRLQKCFLKGAQKGNCEIFVEGLPGMTDNITPDSDGLWVPLIVSADPENPLLPQSLAPLHFIRKFLLRFLTMVETSFKLVQNLYPNTYTENIIHKLGNFNTAGALFPDRETIVRVDWNGNVVGALHGFDGSVSRISHVLEFGDYLYLGSPFNNYIGRVKFVNREKIHPARVEEVPTTTAVPKVTTTTRKPVTTTTTQKPTTQAPKPSTTKKPETQPPKPVTQAPVTTQKPVPKATPEVPKAQPTQKPATEAPKPQTTQKPATETPKVQQTQKPVTQAPKAQPTQKPVTEAPKPKPTKKPEEPVKPIEIPKHMRPSTKPPETPKYPAPIHETVDDIPPPENKEKIKYIKKDGGHGEL